MELQNAKTHMDKISNLLVIIGGKKNEGMRLCTQNVTLVYK